MTLQDTPAFNRAFNGLAELYNLNEYEDRRLRYFQALSDIDIASVESACTEASKLAGVGSCRFFPLPGTLREFSSNIQRTSVPSHSCPQCGGTGMMKADPDRLKLERMYNQTPAQPTVTRCECRV